MTRTAFVLVAALALAFPSLAVADAPRVVAVLEDGTEDVTFRPYVVAVATPEIDVKRMTFSLTERDLILRYDVVNLSHRTTRDHNFGFAGVRMEEPRMFTFVARSAGYASVVVDVLWFPERFGEVAGAHFMLGLSGTDGSCISCGWPELEGEWNVSDNSISVHVPRHHFTGPLTDTYAFSFIILPTNRNSILSTVSLADFMPDHGYGPNVPTS